MEKIVFFRGLTVFLLSWSSYAGYTIQAKKTAEISLSAPTSSLICGDRALVSSAQNSQLSSIDFVSGKVIETFSLPELKQSYRVTSMACLKPGSEVLLALVGNSSGNRRKFELVRGLISSVTHSIVFTETRPLPEQGIVRDLNCNSEGECILIQDQVYFASGGNGWKSLNLPSSKDVKVQKGPSPENPFSDWQSQFDLAKGKYFRVAFFQKKGLAVLDPSRSSVLTWVPGGAEPTKRWGSWGFWEGRLMFPKAIALVHENYFAIADNGTKVISLFDLKGEYQGIVGDGSEFIRFGYVSSLSARERTLIATDYLNNKVIIFQLPTSGVKLEQTEVADSLTRSNLFRHPQVLENQSVTQCLGCHDGYLMNSMDKFSTERKHHPVGVEVKAKTTLPLIGNKISCATCHDPHHEKKNGVSTFLRLDEKKLCVSCHMENAAPGNHFHLKGKVNSCTDCHHTHDANKDLLKSPTLELCTSCHKEKTKSMVHPLGVKGDKNLNCTTCHAMHGSEASLSFAKKTSKSSSGSCLSCHKMDQQEGPSLAMKHELRMKQKNHRWFSNENSCVECHKPHQESKKPKETCFGCHSDRGQGHPQKITINETERAANLHLENQAVSCNTCHGKSHGEAPSKEKVLHFCASCHGVQSKDLFEKFHTMKRKRNGKK